MPLDREFALLHGLATATTTTGTAALRSVVCKKESVLLTSGDMQQRKCWMYILVPTRLTNMIL